MPVNPDFRDLFSAFNAEGVRYLLVGGYAVAFHAEPRFTRDLDLWIDASRANGELVYAALRAFGAPLGKTTAADLAVPEQVLQIGVAPNRVDIVTSIDGVTFEAAWPNRVETEYGDQHIWVIGRADLIANKRASGRPQDGLDIATLERHS